MQEFRQFVPYYQGGFALTKTSHTEKDEVLNRSVIHIENLTHGLDANYTSMMDIKIGTTNVTLKCKALGGADRKTKKEEKTTTPTYGFNMIGYNLRDPATGRL